MSDSASVRRAADALVREVEQAMRESAGHLRCLTQDQVAELLQVDRSTVSKLERQGLKAIRIGKKCVRYRAVDVERLQAQFAGEVIVSKRRA